MKILSIRGRGIRSLAEPFALDLTGGGLANGGLFAIVGPTGSGKSTILDALCLALYGKTPRFLGARGGVAIPDGADSVSENDARTCLSHGVGEGYAEVEFESGDHRYLSRWEVNRARRRPEGRLQPDRMTITDLTAEVTLADKKKEVAELVEAITGLDFEQFQRSVLLAQGQFAKFLLAGEQERAELLETVTGEEIYAQLSTAAFTRAQQYVDRRKALEARGEALELPSQEALDEAEAELGAISERKTQLAQDRTAAEAARRWHDDRVRKVEERGKALERQEAAERALAEFADDAVRLARFAQARELRTEVTEMDRAAQSATEAKERMADAHQRVDGATGATQEAEKARLKRADALAAFVRQAPVREQELAAAGELDARLAKVRREVAEAEDECSKSAQRARTELGASRDLQDQLDKLAGQVEADREWLVGHEHLGSLGPRLAALRTDLEALAGTRKEVRGRTEELARAKKQLAALDKPVQQNDAAMTRASKSLEEARDELARHEAEAGEEQMNQRVADAESAATHAEAQLEEARGALEEARNRQRAAALALTLVSGQPCPVCGSIDHPHVAGDEATAELDSLQELVVRAQKGVTSARGRIEAARKAGERARKRQQELTDGVRSKQDALAALKQEAAELASDRRQRATTVEHLAERARAAEDSARDLADRLEPALGPWRATWEQAGAGDLARDLGAELERFQERKVALEQADRQVRGLEPKRAVAAEAAARAEADRSEAEKKREQVRDACRKTEAERVKLLGGRTVAAAAAQWREEEAGLREALDEAERKLAATRQDLAAATEAVAETARADEAARKAVEAARKALDKALAAHELAEQEVRLLLEQDADERVALEKRKQQLEDERVAAREAAILRTKAVADHEAVNDKPAESREHYNDLVAELDGELQRIGEQDRTLFAQLSGMKQRVAASEELQRKRDDLDREAGPWERLSELIGQKDGGKFRKFAQGLTLARLVALANEQLRLLKPRYRILRVEGTDLDLAILDGDQADQVRAVSSLSGGESFLVSLALALGLARLSGKRSPIQSLFIDEGFGALDQRTLADALETLELLQSQGNTIGIISHVEALRERIVYQVEVTPTGSGRSTLNVNF